MTGAAAVLLPVLLTGCGSDLTELIPKRLVPSTGAEPRCADSTSYPGGGLYAPDVSDTTGMVLNGNAASVDGVLRVASATRNAVGSAYFAETISLDPGTNFSAHFALRIGGGDLQTGADGMAFVLQSSPDGPRALGLDGGGLGHQNVLPSVALEFDPYHNDPDPPGGHLALMLDGEISDGLVGYVNPTFALNDGVKRYVWVDYDASSLRLSVYIADETSRPSVPLLTHTGLSLSATLGAAAYVGFSASAGERFNDHDVIGEAWFTKSALRTCQ